MDIHPGSSVDLILNLDSLKEEARSVKRATVYDVEGVQYILSQTTPPVRKSELGKTINITSLIRRGDQKVRYGFFGQLIDIIINYQLNSNQKVVALSIKRTSPVQTFNLRQHHRVRPGKDWSARIDLPGAQDFSGPNGPRRRLAKRNARGAVYNARAQSVSAAVVAVCSDRPSPNEMTCFARGCSLGSK